MVIGVRQTGLDVIAREVRKIDQYLVDAHATGEILQYILDGNPHAPNCRLVATLAGLDGDDLALVHRDGV